MKPNFALDFRNDAITLLHRTARGWQVVGSVGLDTEDLTGALSYLRTTALELSPKGMTTKLVIPNSQILYTQVQAPAQDAGRRRKQVARALEGVTPYAVPDLAFDIAGSGPTVDVAVIAKETLAEAEAFATEHRFNPVSFVAVPDNGTFLTEPWFGPTALAATLLTEGQRVERDTVPIGVPGRDATTPEPVVPTDAAAEASTFDAPVHDPDPVAELAAEPAPEPPAERMEAPASEAMASEVEAPEVEVPAVLAAPEIEAPEAPAHPEPEWIAEPAETSPSLAAEPAPLSSATEATENRVDTTAQTRANTPAPAQTDLEPEEILAQIFAAERLEQPEPAAVSAPTPPAPPADPVIPPAPPASVAPPPPVPDPVKAQVEEAPIALDVVDDLPDPPTERAGDRGGASRAGVLDPSIPDDLPPPPPASVMVAFGSRRALEAAAKEAAAKANTARAGAARTATGKAPALGAVSATRNGPQAKVTTLSPRPAATATQNSVVRLPPRPGAATPDAMGDAAGLAARPAAKTARKPSAAGKALRGLGALVTSPGIAGAKERRPVAQIVTPPTGPTSAAAAAAATLTKTGTKPYTGGLGARNLQRPKPRYLGLILTGILLVFLALVAAWSTVFLESRDATTPDPNATVDAVPTVDDEMLADLQGPAAEPAPLDTASADAAATDATAADAAATELATDAQADAVDAAVAEAVAVPEAAPEPAPATALQTEAATAAPSLTEPQDEFLLATMDEPPAMPDAASLPQPTARNDALPAPATPPPPFGTVYRFDADGLIVPTPDGILTPEGVLLFAGRPKLEPPPRPAALAGTAEPATAVAAQPSPDAEAAAPVFADPALADSRPRARPADLAPQTLPPTLNADDDASLAPAPGSRFASLRPRAKPEGLAPQGQTEVATDGTAAVPPVNPPANPIAGLGAQGASLTAQANATAAADAATLSPLALNVSRKPAPRPQDMSRAVEAAVAVASRQPDPTPQIEQPPAEEQQAKVEPEAEAEPEVTKSMPSLPTKTTVAKQATFVNAINLSKINLIGVYGSASDRYALIRQTNGRYKKVKVGDTIDGGRVAAITTSEVRYQKSGKMVTLALPKG